MSHLRHTPTMQPKLVETPPVGDGWLHEIKYDGYRTQLLLEAGSVRAFTRNGHDWTDRYTTVCADAAALACSSAAIDGEICIQDERGVTDFSGLRRAIGSEPDRLVFFAFDLLHLNGEDLRSRPLEERRAKLRWLLDGAPGRLHMSDEFGGDGAAFFELADKHGLEGIVSKKKGSTYRSGETDRWVKTKCWATGSFDVIGVEKDAAGVPYALLSDGTGYRGAAYIGLPGNLRQAFWQFAEGRTTEVSPVEGLRKKGVWVQPGLTAAVRYLKGSDKLRHAVVQSIDCEK